jgi:hypothetical protein
MIVLLACMSACLPIYISFCLLTCTSHHKPLCFPACRCVCLTVRNYFFFVCFWRTRSSFLVIFSSVASDRGQPAVKCHPRWPPTRRFAVSCGLKRRRIRTQGCRTTVWHATIDPPHLPIEPPHLPIQCLRLNE